MRVRRLSADDAELAHAAIANIKQPEQHASFDVDHLRTFLSRSENVLIVASGASGPAGFLLAYVLDRVDADQRQILLYEIEVAESHRRSGVGRAMIELLKRLGGELDALKAWVLTDRSNTAAVALYESTGAAADPAGDEVSFVWGADSWTRGH